MCSGVVSLCVSHCEFEFPGPIGLVYIKMEKLFLIFLLLLWESNYRYARALDIGKQPLGSVLPSYLVFFFFLSSLSFILDFSMAMSSNFVSFYFLASIHQWACPCSEVWIFKAYFSVLEDLLFYFYFLVGLIFFLWLHSSNCLILQLLCDKSNILLTCFLPDMGQIFDFLVV